ncbi:MAG: hypothetical protein WD448_12935 [Woeseia sp.]
MPNYDPDHAPNPQQWLQLEGQERTRIIAEYLDRHGGYGGSLQRQAHLQALVETQLAEGVTPVKGAFMRLRDNGLNRHEAIRALASVLGRCMPEVLNSEDTDAPPDKTYLAQLETLTADSAYERRRAKPDPRYL